MEVPFRLVDVFTERSFAGNQLCVVPGAPSGLTPEQMQTIAQEIAFSETTFVISAEGDRYEMRIFTPAAEIPFAGHPTLGTAFILASEGRISAQAVQTTAAGEVPVEVSVDRGEAWMTQLPPEFGAVFTDVELVGRAIGLAPEDLHPDLPMQVISTGFAPLLVPIRDEATLRRAVRDGRACVEAAERSEAGCLYLFAVRGPGDVMARMFDPFMGIGEDPATGSAAGPLGAYLAERGIGGMPGSIVIAQGEMVDRASFLHVEAARAGGTWRIRVGGGVRIVGDGRFHW
jgi:trans-2,3-dihydro-3-hydroxyanthranilate isomerase